MIIFAPRGTQIVAAQEEQWERGGVTKEHRLHDFDFARGQGDSSGDPSRIALLIYGRFHQISPVLLLVDGTER